jgi:hypothetical protein
MYEFPPNLIQKWVVLVQNCEVVTGFLSFIYLIFVFQTSNLFLDPNIFDFITPSVNMKPMESKWLLRTNWPLKSPDSASNVD